MTENVEVKGRRYLAEGRLRLLSLRTAPDPPLIVAECRGSDTTYSLGYDGQKAEWRCTCPARGRCAHLVALQLVVERPRERL